MQWLLLSRYARFTLGGYFRSEGTKPRIIMRLVSYFYLQWINELFEHSCAVPFHPVPFYIMEKHVPSRRMFYDFAL